MKGLTRAGDAATCGHTATGLSNVIINGKSAIKIGIDSAGGKIIGPGAPTVIINGICASLIGDSIAGHGNGAHASAVIKGSSGNVTTT